jgi:hypothetical protein
MAVTDWADDSVTSALVVHKRRGNGNAAYMTRSGGTEGTLMIDTRPSETDPNETLLGRSIHVMHRGDSIGFTLQNDHGGCQNNEGEWINCAIGINLNPEAVSFPAGEVLEIRDAGTNTSIDIFAPNRGHVFGIHKGNVPEDYSAIVLMDNKSDTAEYIAAVDYAANVEYFRVSKKLIRVGGGAKVIISSSPSPGGAREALHLEHGNMLIENGDLITDKGYIQLAETAGEPPSVDCSDSDHNGRQQWDAVTGLLWICDGYNTQWRSIQSN